MRTEKKMKNPYCALGNAFVSSVVEGNRGKIEGNQAGLSDRLRQYSYYVTENSVEAGDALLANDLRDAAKRLNPDRMNDDIFSEMIRALEYCSDEWADSADKARDVLKKVKATVKC